MSPTASLSTVPYVIVLCTTRALTITNAESLFITRVFLNFSVYLRTSVSYNVAHLIFGALPPCMYKLLHTLRIERTTIEKRATYYALLKFFRS